MSRYIEVRSFVTIMIIAVAISLGEVLGNLTR